MEIYRYFDYRKYFHDRYRLKLYQLSESCHTESYRNIRNRYRLVEQVLSKDIEFSAKQIELFVKELRLDATQTKYLNLMIHFRHSKNLREKNETFNELFAFWGHPTKTMDRKIAHFYHSWVNSALLKMISIENAPQSLKELKRKLPIKIRSKNLIKSLALLRHLELIQGSLKKGFNMNHQDLIDSVHHHIEGSSVETLPRTNEGVLLRDQIEKSVNQLRENILIFAKEIFPIAP